MLGQQQPFVGGQPVGESPIAGFTGGRFQTLALFPVDPDLYHVAG